MLRLMWQGLAEGWPLWCYVVGHRTEGRRRMVAADLAHGTGWLPVPCDRCGTTWWTVPS